VGLRSLAVVVVVATLPATAAMAQRTNFDGLNSCQHFGTLEFKRRNAAFRRFVIDRADFHVDRFATLVGNQFISTIYRGTATYEAAGGPKAVRFVCLYAGLRQGAVLVYTLPE